MVAADAPPAGRFEKESQVKRILASLIFIGLSLAAAPAFAADARNINVEKVLEKSGEVARQLSCFVTHAIDGTPGM